MFVSPSLSFFSFLGEFAYYTRCGNWTIHTFPNHLSIPHIGEKCMCESATIVCIVCARMRAAKHDGEDDLIAHLRGILHIFDFQARTY